MYSGSGLKSQASRIATLNQYSLTLGIGDMNKISTFIKLTLLNKNTGIVIKKPATNTNE